MGPIDYAFENAFAVLVACSPVAELERSWHRFDLSIGLVDYDGRGIGPGLQRIADRVVQSDVPMEGLFYEEKALEEVAYVAFGSQRLPKRLEGRDILELFIPVHRKREVLDFEIREDLGDRLESLDVGIYLSIYLDLKILSAIEPNTFLQGLRESVG